MKKIAEILNMESDIKRFEDKASQVKNTPNLLEWCVFK